MVLLNNAAARVCHGHVPCRSFRCGCTNSACPPAMIGLNAAASSVAVLGIAAVTTRDSPPHRLSGGPGRRRRAVRHCTDWHDAVAGVRSLDGLPLHRRTRTRPALDFERELGQSGSDRTPAAAASCPFTWPASSAARRPVPASLDFIDMSGQRPLHNHDRPVRGGNRALIPAWTPEAPRRPPPCQAAGLLLRVREAPPADGVRP